MSNTKIFGANHGIATSNVIPDNNSTALDIESADPNAEDYITIDTTEGSESMKFGVGASSDMMRLYSNGTIDTSQTDGYGIRAKTTASATEPVFIPSKNDPDTGIGRAAADQLSLIAGGQEGIRVTESGDAITAVNVNGSTTIQTGASGTSVDIVEVKASGGDTVAKINTTNTNGGEIVLYRGGSPAIEFDVNGGTYFNNPGLGVDFRVETDNKENAFLIDGSEDSVSVGGGGCGAALTSGTVSAGSPGSPSTTLNGSGTVFHDDFHVGAAIKVGSVVTTVTAISNATTLTLQDAIDTSTTGTTCTRDGGELFAVKTGDSKSLFSVRATGAIQAGSAAEDSNADNNLAIGDSDALDNITQHSGGERNYIFGHASTSYSISTGQRNCFMGYAAGQDVNSGFDNVLLGAYAGSDGTSMQGSTHVGYSAGAAATGNDTVFIGREAGMDSTGSYNTSVGSFSLASEGTATSSSYITALGYKTLTENPGNYNTAIGAHSLQNVNATGTHNTAIGYSTANSATTNTDMVLLGSSAQPSANSSVTNEIVIGKSAAGQGSNTIMLGNSSITGLHCYDTSISSPSDSRIKDNVQDSGLGLDFINALRPVKYQKKHPSEFPEEIREARWADQEVVRTRTSIDPDTGEEGIEEYTETTPAETKPDDWQPRTEYGLIAQEVKATMEAHGGADWQGHTVLPSGMEALKYGSLVTVLVKAVQELTARIEQLELEGGD
jgi:hypothetical protein